MAPRKRNTDSAPESQGSWKNVAVKYVAAILKELGIVNFIVVFFATFMIFFSTQQQKEQFIDSWMLLKNEKHTYCVLIIVFVSLISLIGSVYFGKMLKIAKAENERIGQEKSDLQELLLNKAGLSSSRK